MGGSFYKTHQVATTSTDGVDDHRLFAPAAGRNVQIITETITPFLPEQGVALEIACGSGQHVNRFAKVNQHLKWVPTDIETAHLQSADAHAAYDQNDNVKSACYLDVTQEKWPVASLDFIYNANMIHISPWFCTLALMKGVKRHLKTGGYLFMYGPYKQHGQHISESNREFDESLKARNSDWGIRNLEDVIACAEKNEILCEKIIKMPANNLGILYKKA